MNVKSVEKDVLKISFKNKIEDNSDSVIFDDSKYIKKSSELIREVLMDGGSILQCADGSILATKTTIVTVSYQWDKEKERFFRVKSGLWGRGNKSDDSSDCADSSDCIDSAEKTKEEVYT